MQKNNRQHHKKRVEGICEYLPLVRNNQQVAANTPKNLSEVVKTPIDCRPLCKWRRKGTETYHCVDKNDAAKFTINTKYKEVKDVRNYQSVEKR